MSKDEFVLVQPVNIIVDGYTLDYGLVDGIYYPYMIMKKLNDGKQMKDVWETSLTKPSEKKCGKHPTQKPVAILEKIILASTDESDLILDPCNGSGTTGIVASRLKRKYIGIDKEKDYLDLTIRRLEENV